MSSQNHFWVGSFCRIFHNADVFPNKVTALSDIIKIEGDLGNQIPDKSWMIYLFEFFTNKNNSIPLELDLFCQYDGQNYFEAVFNGVNQYRFTKILPEIGTSYQREIIMNPQNHSIRYRLTDLTKGQSETFDLGSDNVNGSINQQEKHKLAKKLLEMEFEGVNHFTGIEWWNRVGNNPFPIRYRVEISLLRFFQGVFNDAEIKYDPFTSLVPNSDAMDRQYPVSFENLRMMDSCICYSLNNGKTVSGMSYRL